MKRLQHLWAKVRQTFLNSHFAYCFLIAWMITNGWAYLGAAIGFLFHFPWISGICSGYLALLWLPFTPEKIITTFIAWRLMKILYPYDAQQLDTDKQPAVSSAKCSI